MKIQTTSNTEIQFTAYPNKCPFCHKSITPHFVIGHCLNGNAEVFMWCPDINCGRSFIGYYEWDSIFKEWNFSDKVSLGEFEEMAVSEYVTTVSPMFKVIFNQAYFAEQNNLLEICGVGYRKAIEFLIKDYLISGNNTESENIRKMHLGQCIDTYVQDNRIKKVAKRAVWLGNDETHYSRKWEGRELKDLKTLIELALHWIDMEILTKKFESDMPD